MRTISFFIFVLIFSMMNILQIKAEVIASGSCGENCLWEIDGNTNTLNIIGSGAMTNYTHTREEGRGFVPNTPWFEYRDVINTVKMGDGITTMGNHAFESLSYVQNVELPEGLTNISSHAFIGNSSLMHIDLPNSIKSIGGCAFQDAPIENVNIPSGVKSIGWAAFANTKMTNVVVPETVTYLDSMAFGDNTTFNGYYSRTPLQKVYCPENLIDKCHEALEWKGADIISYQKTADGKYQINGKDYLSLVDMLIGNYIPKRIYTLEEAKRLSKPVGNKIMIRYK